MKIANRINHSLSKLYLDLKRSSPTMLSILASIGVVGTAILTARATSKAIEHIEDDSRKNHGAPGRQTNSEAIVSGFKDYIPAILVGTGTIICIFSSNAINKKQQSAMLAVYALANNSFKTYKDKVKELYGEETHNNIVDSIIKDECQKVYLSAPGMCECSTLDPDLKDNPEIVRTFYEPISKRYFESTLSDVIQAEYHLNRNYALGKIVCLNDFYEFLGLSKTEEGEFLVWDEYVYEIGWLDFNHQLVKLDDGLEIIVVDSVYEPTIPED